MIERFPLEQDLVRRNVDLVDETFNHPAILWTTDRRQICSRNVVGSDEHSSVFGQIDLVQVDIAGIRCTRDLFQEVACQRRGAHQLILLIVHVYDPVASADWFWVDGAIPEDQNGLVAILLNSEVERMLRRTVPDKTTAGACYERPKLELGRAVWRKE